MNFHRLDLNLLVALEALLDERHVGRAAERMHVSQPTMSVALAKLRDHYKDELLVRDGRSLALTAFADTLRPLLRQFMIDTRALAQAGTAVDIALSERRFVVVMNQAVARLYLPPLLKRMRQAAPLTTLTCLDLSENITRMFSEGEIDLLLVPTGAWLAGADRGWIDRQPSELLFEDTRVCLAWSGNAAVGEAVTMEQLKSFGHVIATFATNDFRAPAERPLSQFFGLDIKVAAEVPMSAIAPTLVGTPLVTIMSSRMARYEAAHFDVKCAALPAELAQPRAQHLFWSKRAGADPAILWLRSLLREVIAGYAG